MLSREGSNGQHDPRWAAVDDFAISALVPADDPYQESLRYAIDQSAKHGLPAIEVSLLQGKFLQMQCIAANAKNILEVGTLGGYSSILLATSSPQAQVTTIEVDAHHAQVARDVHAHAKLSDRIDVRLGAATDVLPILAEEIREGKRGKFNFVFIDADKENNLNYLNLAIPMCEARAVIVVDNVCRGGKLVDPEAVKAEPRVQGSRRVVEAAGRDERLICSMVQTVGEKGYDGFLMCVVK
ncbi:hypothetical protein D0867_13751 [Hortaea werneckii]|uniref:O-methyltransferase domain-containing protein n=1 Tax=Hortaea werneckii TaxID=91943 RepID=A0A3M6XVA5_HORWE|nr:hypothetical protein D0867_13751 [Hortaea werneckii]RMY14474.1 hypothetical protein D0866_13929 [Hortaea werneckii]